jgi:hypothetical protein
MQSQKNINITALSGTICSTLSSDLDNPIPKAQHMSLMLWDRHYNFRDFRDYDLS